MTLLSLLPPPLCFYQVVVRLLETQFNYSSNMAFPDNIYLRVLMFVCSDGTTLSKRDSPLHDTQHTHTQFVCLRSTKTMPIGVLIR